MQQELRKLFHMVLPEARVVLSVLLSEVHEEDSKTDLANKIIHEILCFDVVSGCVVTSRITANYVWDHQDFRRSSTFLRRGSLSLLYGSHVLRQESLCFPGLLMGRSRSGISKSV